MVETVLNALRNIEPNVDTALAGYPLKPYRAFYFTRTGKIMTMEFLATNMLEADTILRSRLPEDFKVIRIEELEPEDFLEDRQNP